jgi:hypothetical protein
MRMPFAWAFVAAVLLLFGRHAAAAPCAPAEVAGATGQPLQQGVTTSGWYAFTFCPGDYDVGYWYAYGTWASVLPAAMSEIQAARQSVDAFRAAVAGRLTGQECEIAMERGAATLMIDAAAVGTHDALCTALRDDMAARWPPAPVWAVVPSSTGSRPVYRVVDGVRQTSAVYGVRAANSELCACSSMTALQAGSESNRWCPTQGMSASMVTLCGRTQ